MKTKSRAPSRDTSESFRTRSDGAASVSRSNSNFSYGAGGEGFGGGGYDTFPGQQQRASLTDMVSGYEYDPYKRDRGQDGFNSARRPPPRQLNTRGTSIGSKYTPDRRFDDGGRYDDGMQEAEDDFEMDDVMYDKLESGREYSRQMGRTDAPPMGGTPRRPGRRGTIDVRGKSSRTIGRKDGFVDNNGRTFDGPGYGRGRAYADRRGPAGGQRTQGFSPNGNGGSAPPPPARSRQRIPPPPPRAEVVPSPIGLGFGRSVQRMFDSLFEPFGLGGGMMRQMSEMERTMSAQFRSSESLLRDARESILSDPSVRGLLGDDVALGPPRSQSRNASTVDGVTRSRMRIDVPCVGPDGRVRGEACIVSDQDGIVRIEVSAGGRTVRVRSGGGRGGREVIDADILDDYRRTSDR